MASKSRFIPVLERAIEELLEEKHIKGTDRTIKNSTNTLRRFFRENGSPANFEDFDKETLNEKLRLFFASNRNNGTKSGEYGGLYNKNAYVNLRYGLSNHIMKELGLDMSEDPAFSTSHDVFAAMFGK